VENQRASSVRWSSRHGQSLAELLIGMALGAIFIIGAASVIAPSLQTSNQVAQTQSKSELASEMVGNLRSWTGSNWNNLLLLATGSGSPYYLNTSVSPFTVLSSMATTTGPLPITLVQSTSTAGGWVWTGPSLGLKFSSNATARNAIVVLAEWSVNPGNITCTDNHGDIFNAPASLNIFDSAQGSQGGVAVCYALNIAGGTTNVTTTFGAPGASFFGLSIHEYGGIATSSALDATSVNIGTTVSTGADDGTSNSAMTTAAGDLIFGGMAYSSGTFPSTISAGTGNTIRENDWGTLAGGDVMASEDMIQSSAGSVASTWNFGTTNVVYVSAMAAFKAQTTSTLANTALTGSELIAVGSTTYARYFYLSDVYRDSSGNVTTTIAGNFYDPATKMLTVSVRASGTATSTAMTFPFYMTRNGSNLFSQTSWAGGGGSAGATTFVSNVYSNATSVTISASGAIQLTGGSGNSCVY
jgi:hypothetical protein